MSAKQPWHAYYDAMTLGDAIEWRRRPAYACACAGPLVRSAPRGVPCHCLATSLQVAALHRAAHIAVKLIADVGLCRVDQTISDWPCRCGHPIREHRCNWDDPDDGITPDCGLCSCMEFDPRQGATPSS